MRCFILQYLLLLLRYPIRIYVLLSHTTITHLFIHHRLMNNSIQFLQLICSQILIIICYS